MMGILFDLSHVVARARPNIEAADLGDRCQLLSGDFFQTVPTVTDAYVMRYIVLDWTDEKSFTILKNCHAVMSPSNKLLLVKTVSLRR